MPKLIDHFLSWMTDGVFAAIAAADFAPWQADTTVDPHALDIEYFGNRSGNREASVLVERLCDNPGVSVITDTQMQRLVAVIRARYSHEWQRVWLAMMADYDPVANVDYEEVQTHAFGEHHDTTHAFDSKTSSNRDSNSSAGVVPFGGSGSVTISTGRQQENSSANYAQTVGSAASNVDHTDRTGSSDENVDTFHRVGNMGVATSQSLVQAELDLRRQAYFDYIFDTLDNILTIPYWRCC